MRIPVKDLTLEVLVEHEQLLINMARDARAEYKASKPCDFKRKAYWYGRYEAYYEQLQVLYGRKL